MGAVRVLWESCVGAVRVLWEGCVGAVRVLCGCHESVWVL